MLAPARCTVNPWWNATLPLGTSTSTGSISAISGSTRMSSGSPKKMFTNFRRPIAWVPGRYDIAPLAAVEPSNGIHAVTDGVSLIGQYG